MNRKHTPTPWEAAIFAYRDSPEPVLAIQANGQSHDRCICRVSPESKMDAQDIANAAHIVHCVNQHDKLVEALKACESVIGFARLQGKLDDSGLSPVNNALLLARTCLDDERTAKIP